VGKNGRLTLIDAGEMQAENFGRHVLGFGAILLPKAKALEADLVKQFPYISVRSLKQDARTFYRIYEEDLVIDATGEEAFSVALNASHQAALCTSNATPPLLFVWVAGNGEAVQALFVDHPRTGCYRCMWHEGPNGAMNERFPLLKGDVNIRYHGCQSVTMFPVSAAISAAALAADAIIDWVNGTPSPRFRTRVREGANVYGVKNQDPVPLKNCPACQGT
jgi:molybdopterin/thiamine biosynthesis adenylyltransferase